MKIFYVTKKICPRPRRCPGEPVPRLLQLLLTSSPMPWFQFRPRPRAPSSLIRPDPHLAPHLRGLRLALPRAHLYLTSFLSSTDLTPSLPQDLLFRISPRPCRSGSTGDNLPLPRP